MPYMDWRSSGSGDHKDGCSGEGSAMAGSSAMTEEQVETLRHQISIYAAICEQLVEMHRSVTSHQDSIAGMRLGNLYSDPLLMSGGIHKITARQRWSPTPMQLQILENIFDKGNGTPTKQKIKEMASELSQHGQISETNVYNWFQNRRARSKRKQTAPAAANASSSESEAKAENEFLEEGKGKLETSVVHVNPETKRTIPGMSYASNDRSKSSGSMEHMSLYGTGVLNPRVDQLTGKTEMPEGLSSFMQGDGYNMFG